MSWKPTAVGHLIHDYQIGFSSTANSIAPDIVTFRSTKHHNHFRLNHPDVPEGKTFYIVIKSISKSGIEGIQVYPEETILMLYTIKTFCYLFFLILDGHVHLYFSCFIHLHSHFHRSTYCFIYVNILFLNPNVCKRLFSYVSFYLPHSQSIGPLIVDTSKPHFTGGTIDVKLIEGKYLMAHWSSDAFGDMDDPYLLNFQFAVGRNKF